MNVVKIEDKPCIEVSAKAVRNLIRGHEILMLIIFAISLAVVICAGSIFFQVLSAITGFISLYEILAYCTRDPYTSIMILERYNLKYDSKTMKFYYLITAERNIFLC